MPPPPITAQVIGWDALRDAPHNLQVGDIVHVHSRSLLGRLIRWFSRSPGESPSWSSHTGMVIDVGEHPIIIEALSRVRVHDLIRYEDRKACLLVTRMSGLTEEDRAGLAAKALDYEGRKYGYGKILVHALDRMVGNRYVFRRLLRWDDYPICSWLVAYTYDRALGYRFGVHPNAAQPDDVLDACIQEQWMGVWCDEEAIPEAAAPARPAAAPAPRQG